MDRAKEKEEKTVRRKDCLRFQALQREKRAERSVLGSGEGRFLQLPALVSRPLRLLWKERNVYLGAAAVFLTWGFIVDAAGMKSRD